MGLSLIVLKAQQLSANVENAGVLGAGLGNKGLDRCWCDPERMQFMRSACLPEASPHPLQRQHLFNVYVHTQPNFTGPALMMSLCSAA